MRLACPRWRSSSAIGDEVVVVDPDDVVGPQDLGELGGKVLVHAEIAGEVAAGEFGQVDAIVQDRPQHPIGEAVVVFLVVLLRQVGDDVSGSRPLDRLGGDFVGCGPRFRSSRTIRSEIL